MGEQLVRYAVEQGIASITLDSPSNRNALSSQLVTEFEEHLTSAAADDAVRAVVITHTGTVFCAGADLREQSTEGGPSRGTQRMTTLFREVLATRKPMIARIDGAVRAGGLGIVGACDLAFASPASSFAFTEARIGVTPAIISLTTIPRMAPRAVSRYFLTGEKFGAAEAAECGLVTAATDDLDATIAAVRDELRLCSPQGLAETKALTSRAMLDAFDAGAEQMRTLSARLFESDEAREGMTSFLEKRPPRWANE